MRRICFATPIYPPDFHRAFDMLKACARDGIDLFYIFSNTQDLEASATTHVEFDKSKAIGVPDTQHANPVVFKRFYALSQLCNAGCDYILTPDSEVRPLDNGHFTQSHILQMCDHMFTKKQMAGGPFVYPHQHIIWESCASIFSEEGRSCLRQIAPLYTWFSDVPVWETRSLKTFLPYVLHIYHLFPFSHCFDHMMYQQFLALTEN